jgi:ubiquinone biosynthesis UbiH/UbiF/VisC/COQ6 family hydroxylase
MVERARQFGRVHFTAQEAQVRALGYVIANHDLGEQLWQVVQQQDAVTVFDGCELVQASPRADGWQVRLAATGQKADESAGQVSEYCISGRLLVVADGAGSATLKALGIASAVSPYGQSALVLGLTGVQWDQRTALERFLPAGESVAVLPRAEGKVGVVMAAAPEQIAELAQLSDEVLLPKVAERLGWPVAHLGRCLQRGSYPLAATLAQEVVRANLLVVGNAAQALHPIAGQGFNLAVRDLANFLQVLSASQLQRKRQGGDDRDLIPLTYLSAYARAREGDRQRIRQFCHQLLSVFSWQSRPLAVCRQLGMALFDTLPNSKAWLAHSTLAPRVPPQAAWLAERHVANELALF